MSRLILSHLSLSRFRSHRTLDLALDGRPVAIFGPNGAGKTNILEAISLLSPGRGMRRAAMEEIARKPEALGWKLRAELTGPGVSHEIAMRSEAGTPRTLSIDEKPAAQMALGRMIRILWLIPAMDRLWIEGAEGRRRFLDRVTLSFEPAHGEASLAYEKAMRERNRLLKDQARDPAWYGALESQMARLGAEIRQNRAEALTALSLAQTDATTAFPTAQLRMEEAGQEGVEDPAMDEASLREALARGRARDMAAGRTLVGPHRADLVAIYEAKGMEARHCSTGEQKALLISLILANARALSARLDAPPILLLDEVAAHLDEARRAALYDEITGLGAQAFMTGTEPGLFRAVGDRAMAVAVDETDGASTTRILARLPDDRSPEERP
ncbi:DNA replication/repair protein RecF [Brevirhabdus pacifica]|uniref:DNA replication and repair protein RecF n=1 Tax=Brevirhabdus pacifica TaxID=1267768 RepID=A0A1U7DIZ6_9RHOB|nr:DNA replication/repair protein RecF [Brevirhabdus pacifica]APX89964.1 DNA replication/repair protein RecF [Brevirhabdus pacifica]OWU74312.1 recombinase RecF [Loktanella sp. 22II-4b]PJJ82804.1 DNA replication and repair protein RecF [Brevirhabdus pacifica]